MMRRVWTLVPALTVVVFWGCGGSPSKATDGGAAAGSGGKSLVTGGGAAAKANSGGAASSGAAQTSGLTTIDLGASVVNGTSPCPSSCESLNANCGTVTDSRCGGVVACGICSGDETCGSTVPNQCGKAVAACTPKTCEELGANCGAVSDGCGNLLDCGASCPAGQLCGAVTPNRCGNGTTCTPKTCADLPKVECGIQGDGCGNQLDCGTCPSGQQCVTISGETKCVAAACKPKTCADLGIECGVTGDGCGGTLNCGNSCVLPKICGGDQPGKCGCKGVCNQIQDCAAGRATSISGKVYDPAGLNPLPNALVYIPNNPADPGLKPFSARTATCDVCGATAAGDPLVSAQTATDGSFTLKNVPVGRAITLVIQLGRWRRLYQIDIPTPCAANSLPNSGKLTMPKSKTEGDIPQFAVVTGAADGMECVLWKMGVDTGEFTNPTGTGRVHLYTGSGVDRMDDYAGSGAMLDANTPSETTLFVKDTKGNMPLMSYDVLVLSCQGSAFGEQATGTSMQGMQPSLAYWSELVNYGNTGGRIFASHYAYTYLRAGGTANPFYGTANWDTESEQENSGIGTIITDPVRNPKGQGLANWLALPEVGGLDSASTPTLVITDPRLDVASLVAPSQAWMEMDWDNRPSTPATPLHYTFNTPVGSDISCGRVVFSDFHVSSSDNEELFPTSCGSRHNFSAQEKILEYMLFDLSACVTPYTPLCSPRTCTAQGFECGAASDGCGNAIECGTCPANEICGLLSPGKCDPFTCQPITCAEQGFECGAAGDGCGAAIDCGTCPPGQTCGAAGPGKCGTSSCTPATCAQQGIECGPAGDGCGAAIDCGVCVAPEICGGGGPGKCGKPSCTPLTCIDQGIECGAAGDGCGTALNCGNCASGMICGREAPGKCGSIMLL
jgi:hypothetical protein